MTLIATIALIIALFSSIMLLLLWRSQTALGQALRDSNERADAAESRLADVESQLKGMSAGALGQSNKLRKLEAVQAEIQTRLETVMVNEGGANTYNRAIRLAKRGASVQELISDCEITETEADLIVRMHGNS